MDPIPQQQRKLGSTLLIPTLIRMWVIFALLPVYMVLGQSGTDFHKQIDSLIKAAPKTYKEIDAVFRPKRKDSFLLDYFEKKSMEAGYHDGRAYALNQMGRRYRDKSKYDMAIDFHKKALDAAIQADNIEFRIYSLNMISAAHRRQDAIKQALDYSQEALDLIQSIDNPSKGIKRSQNVTFNGLGNIYIAMEQYDLAIAQLEKSMELENELNNTLGLAVNSQNIGECYENLGLLSKAMEYYQKSLAYNEVINSNPGRVICKNSIAQIHIKKGNINEALELLTSISPMAQQLGDQELISLIGINMAKALLQSSKYESAKRHLDKALALANAYEIPRNQMACHELLSTLYENTGRNKMALQHYKIAKKIEGEIKNQRNLRYVNDMIVRYEDEKKSNEIEALAKQNEIVQLKLKKNQVTLLVSGIVLALLAIIFYILYRQYQLKNEKKVMTLEQTMLRSQMNPHFLFNSLNSIKLYIINNEKKNAVQYLNKFSKLVRKILEASSLKEISLAEELETVSLYMKIENIRFSDEIDFKITVDESIDPHAAKVPSLVLQPFLENALWHGLSAKEGEKKVHIHVAPKNKDLYQISITDNGIGRATAERIRAGKVVKRKSMGIDITKERLANFSKDYLNSFELRFEDLFDTDGSPTGTKVILHIPIV